MIPLKDTTKPERFPLINWMLIAANTGVFVMELLLDPAETQAFFTQYALIPAQTDLLGNNTLSFVTNTFLHGGWGHFLSNMWFLYIFGDNVEGRMGHFRYLIFYLLCGILASVTHYALYSDSAIPALGASGAISGVMAAYMFMFPGSTIISIVPVFFLPLFLPIPAVIYIGLWFVGQFLSGSADLLNRTVDGPGIAFWAHIGGFLGGLLIYRFFASKKYKRKRSYG